MKEFFTKRNIAIIVISIIFLLVSVILYNGKKKTVFKDEYMKEVFSEVDSEPVKNEENIQEGKVNIKSNTSQKSNETNKRVIVEIKGEVNKPDVYELQEGTIIKDLIDKAGGLKSDADINKINRAEILKNHQLVIIPNKNDNNNQITNNSVGNLNNNANLQGDKLININTASLEELKEITGVGDSKANKIIEYREKNSGFKSIDEMKNIEGIGEKTFEKLKEEITI